MKERRERRRRKVDQNCRCPLRLYLSTVVLPLGSLIVEPARMVGLIVGLV